MCSCYLRALKTIWKGQRGVCHISTIPPPTKVMHDLCHSLKRAWFSSVCQQTGVQAPIYLWCNDIPGAQSLGSLECIRVLSLLQVYSGCVYNIYIVLTALGLTKSISDSHVFVFKLFYMYLFVCYFPGTLRLRDYASICICICLYCICIYL